MSNALSRKDPMSHPIYPNGSCRGDATAYHGTLHGICDAQSSTPCCAKDGICREPSAETCRCANCLDYRLAGPARTFAELKYSLRSLERFGLNVQSPQHPNGPVRRVFIVYNPSFGNGPPSFIDPELAREYITFVPHSDIFKHPETDLPTNNRNALQVRKKNKQPKVLFFL